MSHVPRISEEMVPEVFDLAARLYAEKNRGYSSAELMEAGAEVKIPPEFIQQAIAQLQSRQIQVQQSPKLHKPTQPKSKLFGIAAGFILGGVLMWTFAVKPTEKTSSSSSSSQETVNSPQTDLKAANLRGANLEGADLKGKNLSSTNLIRANLENANLSKTNLRNANLMRANLENANLSGSDLSNANLISANLENANLSGANLNGANLKGANLEGAKMPDRTN